MSWPLTVVALIDALGWSYVRDSDFLQDLLPYRQPVRTVLGFSSGAIPTMLTGLPPAGTGHWNLFYYDPAHSPFAWLRPFRVLPRTVLDSRYSRALIKRLGRHVLGLGPLFECSVSPSLLPWFNWIEKKNIFAPQGIGGARSIFDWLGERSIPYRVYSYRDGNDAELFSAAGRDIHQSEAQLFFIYLSEMDAFLHRHCAEPDSIRKRLRWYEEELGKVFRAARQADSEAILTVVSDHGMTPITKHYDLLADLESLNLRTPDDYLAVYDSTMARFWFFDHAARAAIVDALRRVPCGRLLSDDELQALGIFFADRRYGEAVFLLEPGCIMARSDFNGASWMPAGMHGFHPDDPNSDAIFLTNKPPVSPLRTIADVYPWLVNSVVCSSFPVSANAPTVDHGQQGIPSSQRKQIRPCVEKAERAVL
jgi:hypothetical protein